MIYDNTKLINGKKSKIFNEIVHIKLSQLEMEFSNDNKIQVTK